MYKLILDTSLLGAQLVLCDADFKIIAQKEIVERQETARLLPQTYKELMTCSLGSLYPLGEVIVSVGPGSFTGIRLGLAWVFGLTALLPIPTVGISSMEMWVHAKVLETGTPAVLFLPNSATGGFVAFDNGKERCCFFAPYNEAWLKISNWQSNNPQTMIFLVEDKQKWGENSAPSKVSLLSLETLAGQAILATAFVLKQGSCDTLLQPLCPKYLRLSSAEERMGQK